LLIGGGIDPTPVEVEVELELELELEDEDDGSGIREVVLMPYRESADSQIAMVRVGSNLPIHSL
jgi:hypothetical protein